MKRNSGFSNGKSAYLNAFKSLNKHFQVLKNSHYMWSQVIKYIFFLFIIILIWFLYSIEFELLILEENKRQSNTNIDDIKYRN